MAKKKKKSVIFFSFEYYTRFSIRIRVFWINATIGMQWFSCFHLSSVVKQCTWCIQSFSRRNVICVDGVKSHFHPLLLQFARRLRFNVMPNHCRRHHKPTRRIIRHFNCTHFPYLVCVRKKSNIVAEATATLSILFSA